MLTLQEQKELWASLQAHAGWKALAALVEEQMSTRINGILFHPLTSNDEVLGEQYVKGEVAAMRLFIELPRLEEERVSEELQKEETEND